MTMTEIALAVIIAAPLVLLAVLAFHSKTHVPHTTTAEQGIRLLYWLARWIQAVAEATDSGLVAYRDAQTRAILPHAEQRRRIENMERENAQRELALVEKTREDIEAGRPRPQIARLLGWLA